MKVKEVVNCGGISEKNAMVMQIYADVCNRPMKITFRFAGFKPAGQRDGLAIFERDLAEIPALPGYMQVDAVDRAAAGAAG